jgi:hypothetical protein
MPLGNYMVGPLLGEGSSAQVKLAKNKLTDLYFAVKIYDKHR